jgi:two-component system, LuxR family, sensor kinase FixL
MRWQWLARADLALLALIVMVAIGLAWELTAAREVSLFVRTRVAILFTLQVAATGVLLVWRARLARDRAELCSLLEYKRGLSELAKQCAALSTTASHDALRVSLFGLAERLGATRLLVVERGGDHRLSLWADSRGAASPGAEARGLPNEAGTSAIEEAANGGEPVRLERVLAIPLQTDGPVMGVLALLHEDGGRPWTDEQVGRATDVADVLAHAIQHVQDRREVRDSTDLSRAVLDSASGDVAILDRRGVVLAVNESWAASPNPTVQARVGGAVLEAIALPEQARMQVETAVRSVLSGERPQATVEYGWDGSRGPCWSEVRVHRLNRSEGGAVLTHLEITARRRAEAEVQRHLHELAHVRMMSGMGELAAAVAHELNQPLTAVLSNAQAARRMMMSATPPLAELREILDDIIEQDKRAGEVIERVRRVVRKDQFDWAPLDLNVLINDVIRLLGNQAALEGVSVAPSLTPGLPHVRGDRVQLQQVVLNLLQNAIHASVANESARRPVVSITSGLCCGAPGLTVRDSGRGIPTESLDRIFNPFYTTKPDGLGVGLSISRSIVELHHGQLTAANHASGGAEFSVTLPAESATS